MISSTPPKGEPLDFEMVTENWAIYEIKDKLPVRLKARLVLNKIMQTDAKDPQLGLPVYVPGTANPIFVTFAPKELRGEPTNPQPTAEQLRDAKKLELAFVPKDEPWSEYRLVGGTTLRIRLVVTGVIKTPFYAPDGDPLYIISHSASGRVIPKGVEDATHL